MFSHSGNPQIDCKNVRRTEQMKERQRGSHPLIRTAECRGMRRDALHMGRRETVSSGHSAGVIEIDQHSFFCCYQQIQRYIKEAI